MRQRILRVVIDPTILVEAILDPEGPCGSILRGISAKDLELLLDEPVARTLRRALSDGEARRVGGWDEEDARRWTSALEVLATEVSPPEGTAAGAPTAVDDAFLDLARRSGAVLVTTDDGTLARSGEGGVEILKPETVAEVLESRRDVGTV